MKKLLFMILILTIATMSLFAAITVLTATATMPWDEGMFGSLSLSVSSFTINDDTDKAVFVFTFPKSGTITELSFSTGTITTGENDVLVRIESLNASGNPSGNLYAANSSGTVDIVDGDDSVMKAVSINGGTGVTVTMGDMASIVIARNAAGSLNGAVFRYIQPPTLGSSVQDYNITTGTTWTKLYGCPMLTLNISGWISPSGCYGGIYGNVASDSFATAAERGILINFPISVRAVGVKVIASFAAASTVKFQLYSDPTGTPSVVATTSVIDTDYAYSTGSRSHSFRFTSSYTLAANTNYVLAMSPQDATSLGLSYFSCDSTYASAFGSGSTGVRYARENGVSAFSATTTQIPIIALIVDGVDVTSSTNGNNFISNLNSEVESIFGEQLWLDLYRKYYTSY